MDMKSVPMWLQKLVSITTFFSACEFHTNGPKNIECNMYCLDCCEHHQALCPTCVSSDHRDHQVIQIRRSSYNEVVRATDIVKRVNILGINPYVINNSRVIFLNKRIRSQPTRKNTGKCYKGSSRCWTCKRNLADPFVFCSLACKLEFIREKGSFVVTPRKEIKMRNELEEMLRKLPEKERESLMREPTPKRAASPSEPSPRPAAKARRTSRRKGIPHRAPFF